METGLRIKLPPNIRINNGDLNHPLSFKFTIEVKARDPYLSALLACIQYKKRTSKSKPGYASEIVYDNLIRVRLIAYISAWCVCVRVAGGMYVCAWIFVSLVLVCLYISKLVVRQ